MSGEFELRGPGGGGDLRRHRRRPRAGAGQLAASASAPRRSEMVTGVPAYVDGRMLAIAERAGGRLVNRDRMWHYVEGIAELGPDLARPRHPDPARPVVAVVRRDRPPAAGAAVPGVRHARHAGAPAQHRPRPLLVRADRAILEKELALSGSEQNPDLTGRSIRQVLAAPGPVRAPPVRGVPAARRRLRRGPVGARAGRGHERG